MERRRGESAFSCGPDGKKPGRNRRGAAHPELTYGIVFCFIDKTILVAVDEAEEKLDIEVRPRDVIGHADSLAEEQVVRRRFGCAQLSILVAVVFLERIGEGRQFHHARRICCHVECVDVKDFVSRGEG